MDGATLILQKNGGQSSTATTDSTGQANLNSVFADDASSLLIVKKEGYSNLVVKCPCEGITYAISPVMQNLDGMRIVLNWGEEPNDLDSHIVYPGNHIYFSNMKGTDALLDVDDTTSFGPETITINRKHDGERYVYAVHDYSDGSNPNSDRLSKSGAKVFVYVGQTLIRTYYVPQNKVGNLWTVFAVTEFPKVSSEIDLFNTQEWNGDALPDRQFFLTFDDGPTNVAGNTDNVMASCFFMIFTTKQKRHYPLFLNRSGSLRPGGPVRI